MGLRLAVVFLFAGFCVFSLRAEAALLPDAERPLYEQALELANDRDFAAARSTAEQGGNDLLNKFFIWLDLRHTEEEDIAFAELDGFLSSSEDWPYLYNIRRLAEEALPADYSDQQVIDWFGERRPDSPSGAMRLAEALRTVKGKEPAWALLRVSWQRLAFDEEEERLFLSRYGDILQKGDHVERLDRLLQKRAFSAARRQAKRLGGGHIRLAEARRRLMLNRPGVDAAIRRVPKSLQDDPGLLYDRARWRYRRGRFDGVVEMLDRAQPVMRQPDRWWRMRHWAARRALYAGKTDQVYRLASAHGLKDGIGFAEGEWLAGWVALRHQNNPERAYRHFARLYDGVSTPISLSRGAYWAGAAADSSGKSDQATAWYSRAAEHATTFYGQRAIERLDRPLDLDLSTSVEVGKLERGEFESRELVRLIRLLGALDERRYVRGFLLHLRRQAETPEEHQLQVELALAIGRTDQAILTAKQADRQGMGAPGHLYPVPSLVRGHLDEMTSPEPALVLALIRQESAFDHKAVSRAGARGLMQLMPATARLVARRTGARYSRAMLTDDPAANMRLGRAYLEKLLQDYGGSAVLALAAYNAGPHRADRWIKAFGDPRRPEVDPVDWIEQIPFNETRNYVQRVLEGQAVYRLALSGQRKIQPLSMASRAYDRVY